MYSRRLFMVCHVAVGDGPKDSGATQPVLKMPDSAAFREPQVNGGHIAHVNEVALEVSLPTNKVSGFAAV